MIAALLSVALAAGAPLIVEAPGAGPPVVEGAGTWLWLNALGPARRAHAAERLEGLATRLEARFHPLVHDFEDEPLEHDVRRFLRNHLPSLTTARTLARGHWPGPQGTHLTVARACPAGARCMALGQLDRQRAFRAWPVAQAFIVRSRFVSAAALAAHLRAWLPPERFGLVITAADLAPRPAPRVAKAAARLHKRLARLDAQYAAWLDQLGAADQPRPVALPVAPDEVWIVPRLSGLARQAQLRATLDDALRGVPVTWVYAAR